MHSDPFIRVLVADAHPIMALGLTALFRGEPDMMVVATTTKVHETVAAVTEYRPDVLWLDVDMDAYGVLRELADRGIACQTVFYTVRMDPSRLLEAIQAGVRGVVLKEMAPEQLLQCVRKVWAGGQWLEKDVVTQVLEGMLERNMERLRALEQLTPREIELVRAVSQGLRNKAIAERLNIKEGTVRIHLSNIYEKLKLNGRTSLTLFARESGVD